MKKLNNKGFSLVELIIVIAIMAILVGVVGTQVIPYLENSRKAKDQQVISSWNTAAMSAYSNSAAKINSTADYTLTITNPATGGASACTFACGSTVSPDPGATTIENYFKELTNIDTYKFEKMESKAGKDIKTVVITIKSTGEITTVTTCFDSAKYKFDAIEN